MRFIFQSEFEKKNKKLVENLNKPSKTWVQGKWETQHDGTKDGKVDIGYFVKSLFKKI